MHAQLPYTRSNLKILGKHFKKLRTSKDYSIRGISRSAKLAHTVIADIEAGNIIANIDTLGSLYQQVGIDLLIDSEELTNHKKNLDLFLDSLYFANPIMAENIAKTIMQDHEILTNSLLCADYTLFEIAYKVFIDKRYELSVLCNIPEEYNNLSTEQKQKYHLFKGIIHFELGEANEAVSCLEDGLNHSYNQRIEAWIMSYLATVYERIYNIHKALHYGLKASKKHAEHAAIKQKITIDMRNIKNLIEVEQFGESDALLRNISVFLEDEDGSNYRIEMDYLRSYWFFRQQNYPKALDCIDTKQIQADYRFYLATVFNKLNRLEDAISLLKKAPRDHKHKSNGIVDDIHKVYYQHLTQKYDQHFETIITKLLDNPLKLPDHNVYRELHLVGIAYYERNNDKDKAAQLGKNYLKKQSLID